MTPEQLGPYKVERLLGKGGMGRVYAGVDPATGQQVALKVLSSVLADDPKFRERFATEIESLKKLQHPNIVAMYGFGEQDGQLFYSMELVRGRSLQDELHSGRRFDWREVTRIGLEICAALKHAHDRGIIHRDLKPANLLLAENEQIKLSDFGIAKLYGSAQLTGDGNVLGTADYMAPEQAEGRPVSVRTDLYSLGSVFYTLLTGRPPFFAPTLAEVIHSLRYDQPQPVRRFAPDTPIELEMIINQLLAKKSQDRIPTALAVANRLRAMEHALSLGESTETGRADASGSGPAAHTNLDTALRPTVETPAPNEDSPREQQWSAWNQETVVTSSPQENEDAQGGELQLQDEQPAAASHFTTVDQERAAADVAAIVDDDSTPVWPLLVGAILAVALLAAGIWYAARPPSADALYETIQQAATGEVEDFVTVEDEMLSFLQRYNNDPRAEEVAEYVRQLDLYRTQKKFEFRARRLSRGTSLSAVERMYLEAYQLSRIDPEEAAERLQALIDVFGNREDATPDEQRTIELAQQQLADLQQMIAEDQKQQRQLLRESLARAERLREESPEEANAIWRGIVELYADVSWADEFVHEARQKLNR